jgi:RNA polymerase subunit RPABC4/transcription elongation factor Spt4
MGITLPPNLGVYISAVLFVLGAYVFALYVGLIVWTFRDIRARSRDVLAQILATLLVAIFTIAGFLVYLLLRPHTTLAEDYERSLAEEAMLQDLDEQRVCSGCSRRVEPDFMVCPSCHQELRRRCGHCGRLVNLNWDVCPYCGLTDEQTEAQPEEAAPSPAPEPISASPSQPI